MFVNVKFRVWVHKISILKFEAEKLGPVVRSQVSANRWLRGIKTYKFPWYVTLVSANHASSNPGLITKCHVPCGPTYLRATALTGHCSYSLFVSLSEDLGLESKTHVNVYSTLTLTKQ